MPELLMLVGLPGTGKSTFRETIIYPSLTIISSDDIIQRECDKLGITYNEGFKQFIDLATKECNLIAENAIKNKCDVIWDQTNLTVNSRKGKINKFKSAKYEIGGIIFEPTEKGLHTQILNSRPGKNIPDSVIERMTSSYEPPTLVEGFDWIAIKKCDDDFITVEIDL